MKRIFLVSGLVIVLLSSFLGITYSYEYNDDYSLKFELIGEPVVYLDVDDEYEELGVKVYKNGEDISHLVNIDNSLLNVDKVGEYKIKYVIECDGYTEYIYREVIIVDKESPVINLYGDEIVYVEIKSNYVEPGYEVIDNYDTDLEEKVIIIGNVNTNKEGEYKLQYRVVDSNGNIGKAVRTVIVK